MSDLNRERDILRAVTLHRRKGDASAQREKYDVAHDAWLEGLKVSADGFDALAIPEEVDPMRASTYSNEVAIEAAELLGVRGGLFRRLNQAQDALKSYRNGAVWETSHNLPQTYNRTNAFKLALIVGDQTLAQLHEQLSEFRDALEQRLSTDERAVDDAWLWADLGDVRLLLGDGDGAVSAYQDFITRARTESPTSTLTVLNEIVQALKIHRDADAARTEATFTQVETMIKAK